MEINAKIYAAAINKDTIKAVWTLMEDFIPTLSREKRKFSCKAITGKNIRGWSMLPKYELQTCAYEVSDPDNWQYPGTAHNQPCAVSQEYKINK